jgi:L-amino acid N-acyltransferase YncA
MIIRAARLADAESGAACHLACWQEAYAELVEPERLAGLTGDLEAKLQMWRRVISEGQPLLVAVEEDEVLGFIAAGPDEEAGVDAHFQLRVMNVRRAYLGHGSGPAAVRRSCRESERLPLGDAGQRTGQGVLRPQRLRAGRCHEVRP